ncbi:stabilizer of axonemal microtubules 5 [Phalacrocorax carbo]|uniref:stabilizer of axonemal microtubules 5 n=1 Tax=Phalacrocorax carbo TaxID=9209 RepID=UPI003119A009
MAAAPVPAAPVPLIPAPLTGLSFLRASHVRLGTEGRAPGSARRPFSHSQFPPFWGIYRSAPAPPPRSGRVLSLAGADGGETCSETRLAFPERPLQPAAPVVPPESRFRMHADPRIRVLTSVTRESFPCPHTPMQRPPVPTAEKWKDSVPCGDKEKIRLPPSVYTFSYPAHEIRPAARPWPSRRGCVPTIKGDGQSYYNTSYQAQFKGEWTPPVKPSEKHMSPIKFGDPRSSGSVSEQKRAYVAPDKRTHRAYDKERAASQIHHTNLQLGDGCTRFSTSTSELFPVHDLEPVITARPNKYASSIPRGDEDPERNQALARTTTTQLFHPETDRWNLAPKPDLQLQKHRSNVCLGDEHSGSCFFSTTQQSDYQPPCQGQRVTADSKSHRESHIPFNYHTDESSVTTTQAMLVPHRQQKQRLSKDMLQQIKCSHLVLPWRAQDLFRTEQKDEFTPKSRDPAEIQKVNSQESCVPLGTLKRYCPQRKVLFAP